MKLGAYAFAVTENLQTNLERVAQGVREAAGESVNLLVFPECALTGYPPRHIPHPNALNFDALSRAHDELAALSAAHRMHLAVGTVLREGDACYNSALLFSPDGQRSTYHKRALWGWDAEHFHPGTQPGVWNVAGLRIGVRICYEVRFPEYFRELYRARTDLNLLLFCDVADTDDRERFDLIRAHIRTRAVENVCPVLTVNATAPFQTAPTGLYDASGHPIAELSRGQEGLLLCDWSPRPLSFGEQGRRAFSDALTT